MLISITINLYSVFTERWILRIVSDCRTRRYMSSCFCSSFVFLWRLFARFLLIDPPRSAAWRAGFVAGGGAKAKLIYTCETRAERGLLPPPRSRRRASIRSVGGFGRCARRPLILARRARASFAGRPLGDYYAGDGGPRWIAASSSSSSSSRRIPRSARAVAPSAPPLDVDVRSLDVDVVRGPRLALNSPPRLGPERDEPPPLRGNFAPVEGECEIDRLRVVRGAVPRDLSACSFATAPTPRANPYSAWTGTTGSTATA